MESLTSLSYQTFHKGSSLELSSLLQKQPYIFSTTPTFLHWIHDTGSFPTALAKTLIKQPPWFVQGLTNASGYLGSSGILLSFTHTLDVKLSLVFTGSAPFHTNILFVKYFPHHDLLVLVFFHIWLKFYLLQISFCQLCSIPWTTMQCVFTGSCSSYHRYPFILTFYENYHLHACFSISTRQNQLWKQTQYFTF